MFTFSTRTKTFCKGNVHEETQTKATDVAVTKASTKWRLYCTAALTESWSAGAVIAAVAAKTKLRMFKMSLAVSNACDVFECPWTFEIIWMLSRFWTLWLCLGFRHGPHGM